MIDNLNGIVTPEKPITADELPERPKMRQVAAWLGLSYPTVRSMVRDGTIPCKVIQRPKGRKQTREYSVYLFDKAALLEWARPEGTV